MKNLWIKGKQQFKSSYQWTKKDRVFTLVNIKTGKAVSFESWQQAKKLGYVKP
jgi:hypothetical protein